MRLHSIENRKLSNPSDAHSATSSGQRFHESQASPLGSAHPEPGVCSHAHQSLFQLPPSIWWAAVAVPHRKPSGNIRDAVAIGARNVTARTRSDIDQDERMPQRQVDDLVELLDL